MDNTNFTLELANRIKDMGQDLIDRSFDIANSCELCTDLNITIRFPINGAAPSLEWTVECVSKNMIDRLREHV